MGEHMPETENTYATSTTRADKGERVVATVIDLVVAGALSSIFFHPIAWAVSAGYLLTRDALPFLNGQSIGKKVLNLRAVKKDGRHLTDDYGSSVLRNLPLVFPLFQVIELVFLWVSQDSRRIGDQFADTKVIKEK